ncbi:hypothetical protein PILCRDRAFT_824348 [Piloderma croceum F 1598]|uniref:Uncharacterized protein n=1 Tax=Piloderma croceum (strain F 1598) TaxID=765440 RepID=A0A0C3AWR8_PILCF|nr:hypothetical protein PILCRDRAFT_824348 [Piloderma croceum F 1598]
MSGQNTTTQTNTTVSQSSYTHVKSTYSQPSKPASPSFHMLTSPPQPQQSSSSTTIRSGASTVAPVFF